jgi:hypothetical protein
MLLLQAVTSALLLHFSRPAYVGSSSSSLDGGQKIGIGGFLMAINGKFATQVFTVTTVTNYFLNQLKINPGLSNSLVTVNQKTEPTVTSLLQIVTNCYIELLQTVTAITNYKTISYKICNSSTPAIGFLRISREKNFYHF